MITNEQATFTAQGDSFLPSLVAAPYTSFHDPGVIRRLGRYKGIPVPYGVASIEAPEGEREKIACLHRIVVPLLKSMRSAGAQEFRLHLTYRYESQCAIGFSKLELQMMAEMDCDVPIDCWTDQEQPNQAVQRTSATPPSLT